MKKWFLVLLALCLTLSGCQAARVPGLDWDANKTGLPLPLLDREGKEVLS